MGKVEDRIINDLMDVRKETKKQFDYYTDKAVEELRKLKKLDDVIEILKHSMVTADDSEDDHYNWPLSIDEIKDTAARFDTNYCNRMVDEMLRAKEGTIKCMTAPKSINNEDETSEERCHRCYGPLDVSGYEHTMHSRKYMLNFKEPEDVEVCSTDAYGDKYYFNMKICLTPSEDVIFPYFKVYHTLPKRKYTKVARLHFLDSEYEYIDVGNTDPYLWKLTSASDNQNVRRLLNDENVTYPGVSNWDYMKYQWNKMLKLIPDDVDISKYLSGDFNSSGKQLSRLYIPSYVKIPRDFWEYSWQTLYEICGKII